MSSLNQENSCMCKEIFFKLIFTLLFSFFVFPEIPFTLFLLCMYFLIILLVGLCFVTCSVHLPYRKHFSGSQISQLL